MFIILFLFFSKQTPSHREYLWWKNKKHTYGHYKLCDNEEDLSGFLEDTSYLGIPTDLKRCDTCVCSVDMNAIKKRIVGESYLTTISISPQMSNISDNMLSIKIISIQSIHELSHYDSFINSKFSGLLLVLNFPFISMQYISKYKKVNFYQAE